jgi:hypothetical protein
MCQAHVVSEGVHSPAGGGIKGRWEDQHLPIGVTTEEHHLGIKVERLGIIHVNI